MNNNTKIIIIVALLLLVVILSGSLTLYYLHTSARKLEAAVNATSDSVENKQWISAEDQLKQFEKNWENTKYYWAMLVDHFEIDNIDDSFNKSKKYIESQESASSLAELEALKHYILHIPQKEGFTLENIF